MNTVATAEIDVAATDRRIVEELTQHERYVTLSYPASESTMGKTHTHQEVWEMVEKRLSEHYGVEIKFD